MPTCGRPATCRCGCGTPVYEQDGEEVLMSLPGDSLNLLLTLTDRIVSLVRLSPHYQEADVVTCEVPAEAASLVIAAAEDDTEADAAAEAEEAAAPTCSVCDAAEDDCDCRVCENCSDRVATDDDDWCNLCDCCSHCCRREGECWTCEGCDRRYRRDNVSECSSCNHCERCCECIHCPHCREECSDRGFCDDCDRCTECCRCEGDDDDAECHCEMLTATNRFHSANRKQHTRNPSKRFIAAEIEVAALGDPSNNSSIYNTCRKWGAGIVHDGSLPSTGFEITTAPAAGDVFCEEITAICRDLANADAKVTAECGLHVHVDARDFGWWEVRRLIRVYALIEEALFAVVSPSRRTSSYCKRCGSDYLASLSGNLLKAKAAVTHAVYKRTDIRGKRREKYAAERYQALNLHSWFMRGTIECRLFNGTVQAEKIIRWGMLWASILDWVYTHTDKDITALTGSSWQILQQIAPSEEVRSWLEYRRQKHSS